MKKAKSASFSTNEETDKLLAEQVKSNPIGRSGVVKLAIKEFAERHRPDYRPTPGQTALLIALVRVFKAKPDGRTMEERFFSMAKIYEEKAISFEADLRK